MWGSARAPTTHVLSTCHAYTHQPNLHEQLTPHKPWVVKTKADAACELAAVHAYVAHRPMTAAKSDSSPASAVATTGLSAQRIHAAITGRPAPAADARLTQQPTYPTQTLTHRLPPKGYTPHMTALLLPPHPLVLGLAPPPCGPNAFAKTKACSRTSHFPDHPPLRQACGGCATAHARAACPGRTTAVPRSASATGPFP